MASEDIIKHIIRDIVAKSTVILKTTAPQSELPTIEDSLLSTPLIDMFVGGVPSFVKAPVVSDTLTAFVIRSVVLDPANEFGTDRELSPEQVDRLVSICVDKLTSKESIVMETVKMQVYFDTLFPAQSDFLHREKVNRSRLCASLLNDVMEVKTKSVSSYESLYRKIVSYLLVKSHVGNPTSLQVIKESTAALESIFPQSELSTFVSFSRLDKEAQLNGLSQLVTGIRLFNKTLKKGGDTIEPVPELCISELRGLSQSVDHYTEKSELLIQTYSAVSDYAFGNPTSSISISVYQKARSALAFHRQFVIYLDAMREEIETVKLALSSVAEKFEETIQELKKTCKSKTAVPVDQVYPLFMQLAHLWGSWTDELFLLAFRRGILIQLASRGDSFSVDVPSEVLAECEIYRKDIEPEILEDNKIVARAAELMARLAPINRSIEVLHPGNTAKYQEISLEYGGFCSYTLVEREGMIVPADKNVGILRFRDRVFGFVSLQAALEFARTPDKYLEGVLQAAKQSYDLIQICHLYGYFPTVEALEKAKSHTRQSLLGQKPMTTEIATQIDTHIIDTHVDPNYRWNEWELRRHALMLVNLKTKKTHSAQTNMSHYRRESETQYYPQKTSETQTVRSTASNVPRSTQFLAGLRHGYSLEPPKRSVFKLFAADDTIASTFKKLDLTLDNGVPAPYAKIHP